MNDLPQTALAIRQPWAWLVTHGHKTTENRSKPTSYRGPVLIHAGLKTATEWDLHAVRLEMEKRCMIAAGRVPRHPEGYHCGGIVGVAEIVDCKLISDDPWHLPGYWGWKLANARPLDFMPCRGMLGFFNVIYQNAVALAPPPQRPACEKDVPGG